MERKSKKELKKSMSSRKADAKASPKDHKDVESPIDKEVRRDVKDIYKRIQEAQGRKAKEGICWKSIGDNFRSSRIRRHANE